MGTFYLPPNVCAICNKKHTFNLDVMRLIKHEEKLYMDVPVCEKHWNEGKELHGSKISRLFVRTNK